MNYRRDSDCSDDSDTMKTEKVDITKDNNNIPFLQNLSEQSFIETNEKIVVNKNKFLFNNRINTKSTDVIEPMNNNIPNSNDNYDILSQTNTNKTKHIRRRRKISRSKKIDDMDIDNTNNNNNNNDFDDDYDWCADSMAVELSSVVLKL